MREFCENRAFIRAVVSLPQETFFSSGASVKASLLFMQKFTEKEQAEFDAKQAQALAEVTVNYTSNTKWRELNGTAKAFFIARPSAGTD